MSKRTITAHYTEPQEWLAEIRRDAELVERRIVRVCKTGRPVFEGTLTRVSVEASAIIEGRVVRLLTVCGDLWGTGGRREDDPDRQVQEKASSLVRELESELRDAGLEIRAGLWVDE
ncbi:MAG TPA: hypothetical protein VMB51_01085 [Solirubrobacteraceae bacterium]|nr:hypothetical protein [Solirubrobacteraceae bacterium]